MWLLSCSPWEGDDKSCFNTTRLTHNMWRIQKGTSEVEPSGVTFRWWKWKVIREHKEMDHHHLTISTLARGPLGLSQMPGLLSRKTTVWRCLWRRFNLLWEHSGWLLKIILFLHLFERTKQAGRNLGKSSSSFTRPEQSNSFSHKALTCHQRISMKEISLSVVLIYPRVSKISSENVMPNAEVCYTSFMKSSAWKLSPNREKITPYVSPTALWFKHNIFLVFPKRTVLVIHVHFHNPLCLPDPFLVIVIPSPGDTPYLLHFVAVITFGIGQHSLIMESFPSITELNIEPKTRAQIYSLCLSQWGSPDDRKDTWQPKFFP